MNFQIDNLYYPVEVIRKKNKNTYIRVKSGNVISVTTNRWVTDRQIEKLLKENEKVLKKMLIKCQKEEEKKNNFYILGQAYDIIVVSGIDKIEISDNKVFTPTKRKLEL